MPKLINLTGYTLVLPGGITLESRPAPVGHETVAPAGFVNDLVPLVRKAYGPVEGLPEPNGARYIVADEVRRAYPERYDLLAPGDVIERRGMRLWLANLVTN